jgi:hypothetical protein
MVDNVYLLPQDVLYTLGVTISTAFLERNVLRVPEFIARTLITERAPSGSYGCGVYLHRCSRVVVNPYACAKPAHGTPRKWSFPGYTPDRTPVGVVAHEVGHHVDEVFSHPSAGMKWREAAKGAKVSSYEPDLAEAFAESVRLFITNPAMLHAIAPARFTYLANVLGLVPRPGATADPLAQLRAWGASPAILRAASNKAGVN